MQQLNRTVNTRRNIVWGFVAKAVSVLGPFFTRTALIYCLGVEYLGVSSLFTSILQVLSLAELGFSSAVVYGMYKPISEGNIDDVAAYLNYFKTVYRIVGVAIAVMGIALMPFLEYLVKGSWPSDISLQAVFAIYLFNVVIGYFLYAYKQSLLNAWQRNDIVNKVNITVLLTQYAVQVAVLLIWPNYYTYAIVMPLCTVVGNLLVALASQKTLPEFNNAELKKKRLRNEERAAVRKRVVGLMFQQIGGVIRNSSGGIVISAFMGLTAIACYSNYNVVITALLGVLQTVGVSMTAAVGNSVATESRQKNFEDLRLFVFLYAMVAVVCSAVLLSCFQPFMHMWVGEANVLPMEVPLLMTALFYLFTMGDMRFVYVNATGTWWEQRWRALIEAFVNLALNILLVQQFGISGIIVAMIATLFFVNFLYGSHIIFKCYFGMRFLKFYFADHAVYLAAGVLACVLSFFAASLVTAGGVIGLCIKGSVSAVVSSSFLLLAFCWSSRFKRAFSFVKHVLSARNNQQEDLVA